MNFSEQLNKYISALNCSAKELSDSSSISTAVISRYRNNQRTPEKDSELLKKLANGIAELALKKNLSNITYKDVFANLNNTISTNDSINFDSLSKNFDKLLSICSINMGEMARSLSFDASYLSRIRNGKRKPSNPELFIDSVCNYIVRRYNSDSIKQTVSSLIGCDCKSISDQSHYFSKLKYWICSETAESHNYINDFLQKLNDFDLDEYIHAIHFDELKVPSVPFQFPTSRNYYGIEEMKKGELDFFKATVLSKSNNPVFMCSNMPMEDMAKDLDFGKKWMFAIAMTLKKGLHLNIIHNLNRPFNEMMLGLESWIPIYMTGQISPYYLKGVQSNVYCNLDYVSGNVALTGENINGHHNEGKYYLTNNKEEVSYYRKKADCLIKKASPLMDIYLKDSSNIYNAFLKANSKGDGKYRRILSAPPIFAISEDILQKIFERNSVSNADKNDILNFVKQEGDFVKTLTTKGYLSDEFTILSKDEFEKNPVCVSLSGMFYNKKLLYTYDEYLEHIELTKQYNSSNSNYSLDINDNNPFKNIQIFINENKWVVISKESDPTIHFVIHHPKLCNAIENFIVPISE